MELIKNAVEAFIKGGDTNDVALLENILHPAFQNIQDGFFAEKGIYVFSKTEYIELVRSKRFGGSPRTIHYASIEKMDNIAIAKVELESQYIKFFSTIICVCIEDEWKVINNLPKVEAK